jgi:hypothetical protein
MKAAGYDKLSAEQLVRLRDHGVSGAYVRDLGAQGFKNVPLEDVVRSKDHGVSAEYVADMKALGFKDLTLDQIVRLRDPALTPRFVTRAPRPQAGERGRSGAPEERRPLEGLRALPCGRTSGSDRELVSRRVGDLVNDPAFHLPNHQFTHSLIARLTPGAR